MEYDTQELLSRIAQGSEEAFGLFYDRISPLLRGMLVKILASREEAEEVLEEAFLSFWKRALPAKNEDAAPEVWLVLAARSAALRRRKQHEEGKRKESEFRAAWLPRIKDISLLSTRLELLFRSFAQLSASQRRILEMLLFEGLDEKEIADSLGKPAGRARDEVRAAFGFMRQRLHTLMGTWTADI